jgi:mono/diheme cytochrome c family protein
MRKLQVATALLLAVLVVAGARVATLLEKPPPLLAAPELVVQGKAVFQESCLHCHRDIPLSERVRGWSLERAYRTLGELPKLTASMPPFHGTEEERRAVAAYLYAMGKGEAETAGSSSRPTAAPRTAPASAGADEPPPPSGGAPSPAPAQPAR